MATFGGDSEGGGESGSARNSLSFVPAVKYKGGLCYQALFHFAKLTI